MAKLKSIATSTDVYPVNEASVTIPANAQIETYTFVVGETEVVYQNKKFLMAGQETSFAELTKLASLENFTGEYPFVIKSEHIDTQTASAIIKALFTTEKIQTLDDKIMQLENDLSTQRNLDQMQADYQKLEKEVKELTDQFGAVESLLAKLDHTKIELTKLQKGGVATEQQVQELRGLVINFIRSTLRQPGGRIRSVVKNVSNYVKNMPLWPLVVFAFVNFGFATIEAIMLKDLKIMALGIILAALQGALIIVFLSSQQKIEVAATAPIASDDEVNVEKLVEPNDDSNIKNYLDQHHLTDVTSAFVNSAMLTAYEEEIQKLTTAINNQLNGADVEKIRKNISDKQQELTALSTKIENAKNGVMTPDQYLRKRRELDMLKMEKRRESFEKKNISSDWVALVNNMIDSSKLSEINIASEVSNLLSDFGYANGQVTKNSAPVVEIATEDLVKIENAVVALFKNFSAQLSAKYMLWPVVVINNLRQQFADLQGREIISLNMQ